MRATAYSFSFFQLKYTFWLIFTVFCWGGLVVLCVDVCVQENSFIIMEIATRANGRTTRNTAKVKHIRCFFLGRGGVSGVFLCVSVCVFVFVFVFGDKNVREPVDIIVCGEV
jgi:hypothetical protein